MDGDKWIALIAFASMPFGMALVVSLIKWIVLNMNKEYRNAKEE